MIMGELKQTLKLIERDERREAIQRQTRLDELSRRLDLIEHKLPSTIVPDQAREAGIQLLHAALTMGP